MEDYWHTKKEMPENIKKSIKELTSGQPVEALINEKGESVILLNVDGETFAKVFAINRKYLYRGDFTAPVWENDFRVSENYLTEDGLAGFTVTKDGWLTTLFSNLSWHGFGKLIAHHVQAKANKLVCFSTTEFEKNTLAQMYAKVFGFKVFATTIDDHKVMRKYYGDEFVESFIKAYGMPHHIFMVRTDKELEIEYKFNDYFEAYDFVNSAIGKVE